MADPNKIVMGDPYPFALSLSIRSSNSVFAAHHWILIEPATTCCSVPPLVMYGSLDADGRPVSSTVCGECAAPYSFELDVSDPLLSTSIFYGVGKYGVGQTGTIEVQALACLVSGVVEALHPNPLEAELISEATTGYILRTVQNILTQLGWACEDEATQVWNKPDPGL